MKFRIILLTMVSLCVPATAFAQEAYFYTQAWFDLPYSGTPEVTITCDSGVPLMQTDVVPVTFRVDFLMNGTVCEIVQNEIEGFTTSYAANTVRSDHSCLFVGDNLFPDGLNDCHIQNTAVVVSYTCSGFGPPMSEHPIMAKKNRAFPLKMQLFEEGYEVTDADVSAAPLVEVMFTAADGQSVVDVTDDLLSVGLGTEGNQFVYTDAGQWQFNLKAKNYSGAGVYVVTTTSGAPDEYVIDPACVTSFEVQ